DSLWARAVLGPNYPAPDHVRDRITILEQLVARFPDQADAWFELADEQFHEGSLVDSDSATAVAERNFSRAVALDSGAVALDHLLFIAIKRSDLARMGVLLAIREARDTLGPDLPFLRWRVALARGDSSVVRQIRARIPSLAYLSLSLMTDLPQLD